MQPSRITRIYRNAVRLFAAMKSENIGGLVSMAGSCLFLLGGDSAGIIVALSFLVMATRGPVIPRAACSFRSGMRSP
jgi:hypothetical protein